VKLRIHGNSLRFRLNRSDVEQFRKAGICAETIHFGPGSQLTYTLETSSHWTAMDTRYDRDCIRVLLPLKTAEEWADSDQVSLSLNRPDDSSPSLLVEKDFQCLHSDERDPSEDADSFPSPSAAMKETKAGSLFG
jgi:hypothetical protein